MKIEGRKRLEPAKQKDYAPWVRAETLPDMSLFWMPVQCFPMPHDQRTWLLRFTELLSESLQTAKGLREEVFLGFPTIVDHLNESFTNYSYQSPGLPGLGRKPNEQLRGIPDTETIQDEVAKSKKFDMAKWTADYAVWFQIKQARKQHELFSGYGGLTTIFLASDKKTKSPALPFSPKFRTALPVFQKFDIDGMVAGAYALQDGFLAKSKAVFGQGLTGNLSGDFVGFVLPLLSSGQVLAATPEQREEWFTVFDVYLHESLADSGIILAFEQDYDALFLDVLLSMTNAGLMYPQTSWRKS